MNNNCKEEDYPISKLLDSPNGTDESGWAGSGWYFYSPELSQWVGPYKWALSAYHARIQYFTKMNIEIDTQVSATYNP